MKEQISKRKRTGGFTLTEALVVVAIMVILFGVVIGGLLTLRKNLRQKELDAKAEIIYVAAQNRLTELRAAGFDSLYTPSATDGSRGIFKMNLIPDDAEDGEDEERPELYYITSADKTGTDAAASILPSTAVDKELWDNNWIIEYSPKTGSVYAVFYSEEQLSTDETVRNQLRYRKNRLKDGAKVGYYGGDVTRSIYTTTLAPSIDITNNEQLIAKFYCNSPDGGTLTFEITITDKVTGDKYTRTVEQSDMRQTGPQSYYYSWTLDSLREKEGFEEQTGLPGGNDITIKLTAKSSSDTVDDKDCQRDTNSLFADPDFNVDKTTDTAYIAYGRHLQNLTKASSNKNITKAVLVSDISFRDDKNNAEDYYTLYGDNFTPIVNPNLNSFTGSYTNASKEITTSIIDGLHVQVASGSAGLFDTFAGTMTYVTLTGAKIESDSTGDSTGGSTGGLMGRVTGNTTLDHCMVFLSDKQGDDLTAVSELGDLTPWLQGNTVGGLVGTVTGTGALTIQSSMAATVINGKNYAGGLVGTVSGNGSLQVTSSYSDCYLFSDNTGGIAGGAGKSAKISLQDFYTVGYQVATSQCAGLVPGKLTSAKNGYTGVEYQPGNDTCAIYTTAMSSTTTENVYYLNGNMGETTNTNHMANTFHATNTEIRDLTKLSNAFTLDQAETHPYNLLDQGLAYYGYPRISGLEHYGDWAAEPDQESLVYYEVYNTGNGTLAYGFYGANMTTLRSDPIVGDGYALATTNKPTKAITVTYANGDEETLDKDTYQTVTAGSSTYYLLPLNSKKIHEVTDSGFYEKVTIGDKDYYYNPYFAKTVAIGSTEPKTPQTVYIRTPRHLYELSKLYGNDYRDFVSVTADCTFRHEVNLDYSTYHWTEYTALDSAVTVQEPIGSWSTPFRAAYNGGCHYIQNLSISTTSLYVGLFGCTSETGTIRNLFLNGNGNSGALSISHVKNNTPMLDGSKDQLYLGALVGYNKGGIENCAVTGYQLTQYGYNNSAMYLGGLAGGNSGTIYDCSADTPSIVLSNDKSSSTVGGFVGQNIGSVSDSYASGSIQVLETKNSTVTVSGFMGSNLGYIGRCYAGTALTISGEAAAYGFGPKGNGTELQCYYLDEGTYSYCEQLYSFNASQNDYKDTATGTALTGEALATLVMGRFGTATEARLHDKTNSNDYPYPAVIHDESGKLIHIGNWASQEKDLGNLGVFYWEYESGGSNSGYHFSYVGTIDGEPQSGNSLCVAHNDGGVITSFGYGYFYKDNTVNEASITLEASDCTLGDVNAEASDALKAQLPQYTFVAYETGENSLHLTGPDVNSNWTLTYNGGTTYTYSVCPFFANSIALVRDTSGSVDTKRPGTKENPYEIRSVAQLQYINWNYGKKSATTSIDDFQTELRGTRTAWGDADCGKYPYLICSTNSTNKTADDLVWNQSHDLNAYLENTENFTPIGSFHELNKATGNSGKPGVIDGSYSIPVMAYFAGSYNGNAYAIKNIEINTSAEMIGLFGITVGADMKNVVLYSDRGNTIQNTPEGNDWYCIGGLVGFAAKGTEGSASFTNCTVSGYKILDQRDSSPGWGGGCVGGLVGATNMDITKCTAVTDITLAITYKIGYMNLRVGGVAGVCRGTVDACYAGGSIVSTVKPSDRGTTDWEHSTSIWVGGIVGGIVMRNQGDLKDLVGSVSERVYVNNSYSYVEMPAWSTKTWVMGTYAIASNGEMQVKFDRVDEPIIYIKNCYALDTAAAQAEDYKLYIKKRNTNWNGWNMNAWGEGSTSGDQIDRQIYIYNKRCPYLSYQEMTEALLGYLNEGGGSFGFVTTYENGASIIGKYSFPGNDTELQSLNYPFPTVLTQRDVFGATVNVHYGRWPKFGLYWDQNTGTIDLIQDRTQTTSVQNQTAATATTPDPAEPDSSLEEEPVASASVTAQVMETGEPAATQSPEATPEVTASQAAADAKSAAASTQDDSGSTLEPSGSAANAATQAAATSTGAAYLTRKLMVYSVSNYNYDPKNVTFGYFTEDNVSVDEAASPAVVESCTAGYGCYEVKIKGQQPGTIIVRATIYQGNNPYTADLTVTVTASLQLVAGDGKGVTLYEQDSINLPLTLKDQNGTVVQPSDQETISYSVSVRNPDSSEPTASAVYNEKTGQLDITALNAGSRPEAVVTVTATYTPAWGAPITASTTVTVTVKSSVHLGVTDGTDYNEVSVLHTQPAQTSADTGKDKDPKKDSLPKVAEEEDAVKNHETMWLYATKDYVDLTQLYVEQVTLTIDGTKHTLTDQKPTNIGEGYQYAGDNYQLTLGDIRTSKDGSFTYRSITLTDKDGKVPDEQWTIELLVTRQDNQSKTGEFKLTFKRANTITLMSGTRAEDEGTVLTTLRLPQGGDWSDIPVEQEALNSLLAGKMDKDKDPGTGKRWVWTLPAATSVTGNTTIYCSSEAISYQIAFNGNYDGWELDGYEMAPVTLSYGDSTTAPECRFVRNGYTFMYWATDPDGEETYNVGAELKNLTTTHGETVTLYAVWSKDPTTDQPQEDSTQGSTQDSAQGSTQDSALAADSAAEE